MNDSPGWASPGSSPSDGERPGAPADGQPTPPTAPAPPAQPAGDSKWSTQQPPPGQWSSPATPTPPAPQPPQTPPAPPQPGAGWGSPHPYGQQPAGPPGGPWGSPYGYQGGPPPAAKPGVIPLRPLGLGEILDGAVTTMRTHWRSVLPITLVVATVVQVLSVLTQKFLLADLAVSTTATDDPSELLDDMGSSLAAGAAVQVIQFLGTIAVTAMLTMIFSKAVLGHVSSVSGAWRDARPQLLRLIGLTLLFALGLALVFVVLVLPGILTENIGLGALGFFAGVLLAVWLWIRFSLASPALMLERSTVFRSFGRSAKLVKGAWWRIFGITILTVLIVLIVAAIITMPLQLIGIFGFGGGLDALEDGSAQTAWGTLIFTAVGAIIAQTIVMPMQSGVTVLLYVDQRIRREGLDLELARAAGVEGYGPPGAGG